MLPPRLNRNSTRVAEQRECPAHRKWVRGHACSVPGCERGPIECAHVRTGTDGGVGLKPSDRWCISLCAYHHAEQHRVGEAAFEAAVGLNLQALAEQFARRSPHARELVPIAARA